MPDTARWDIMISRTVYIIYGANGKKNAHPSVKKLLRFNMAPAEYEAKRGAHLSTGPELRVCKKLVLVITQGCCCTAEHAGTLGLRRRGIQSMARDEAGSLRAFV